MARAFILVLDSFGIGAAPDAAAFDNVGSDTLGHIAEWCAAGHVAKDRPQSGLLYIPNMARLGLGLAAKNATGSVPAGLEYSGVPEGIYAACAEMSKGKDTPSGHWEMAGVPVMFDWGYFGHDFPSFPKALTDALIERCGLPGVIGNCHASGTTIIAELGNEHVGTGKPIVYTSADSVFQIAAHEDHFGLDRLYDVCEVARELVDEYNIGRVIARPFVGKDGDYERTGNRRDYVMPPPDETLLDELTQAGREVISVGKIADVFAHCGITQKIKAVGQEALFQATMDCVENAPDGSLTFVNFVNFDQDYGHRRNVAGYAAELEAFDRRLPQLEAALQPGDMVILTADHGCDPTWEGSDHTREYVPLIAFGPGLNGSDAGERSSFADVGQTVADHLGLSGLKYGHSVLP